MFRRRLLLRCALIALALGTVNTARLPAATTSSGGSRSTAEAKKTTTTGYTVYYRRPNTTTWNEREPFPTYEAASAATRKLHEQGFETHVQANTALVKLPARPKTARIPERDTVTMKQAKAIFTWMKTQRDIAFRYPADGCYARAHLMVRRLQEAGYKPYKAWSFQNGESLYARTKNHPQGYVTWKYHVAPILRVRFTDGNQAWYVIDPSLFKAPVTVTKWRDGQKRPKAKYTPYLTLTRIGQAPLDVNRKRLPGSGYWPGHDPREGMDKHASRTMKRYKPWEGRVPPRDLARATQPTQQQQQKRAATIRLTGLALATGPARNRLVR
jgi:hypothetical protein